MARRSEAPETSQEILRRLTRFSARVLDAPIAHVAVTGGACQPSASVGLGSSLAKHRTVTAFASRVRRVRSHRGATVESIGSGLSAAGVPLTTSSGAVIGSVCVADAMPRTWTAEERDLLCELAWMVATELELRSATADVRRLATESEERRRELEAVVEASPLAILAVDRDGNVQTWNRAAEQIFGWSADEVIGRPSPAVPDDLVVECGVVRERALQAEAITGLRTLRLRKDGTPVNVSLSTAPLRGADGEIVGVIALLADISDRVAAEEALRASEARKTAILESSLDCVITIDATGAIVEWNPAAERTFGYSRAEAIGRPAADVIVPPALREQHRLGLARYLETGESSVLGSRFETTAVRADGTELPIELALTRVDTPGPPLFTAFARDLTERREADEALRRSEQQRRDAQKLEAIGRVAGEIAHDFNNMIGAIRGYGQLLEARLDGEPRQDASAIVAAADRATAVVRQLLAFSRGDPLQPTLLDLNEVVRNLGPLVRKLVGEGVQLVTLLDPALQPLLADRSKLEQVIVNLVVNARDAMPHGGQLTIRTRALAADPARTGLRGRLVSLTIADTGVGMNAEAKAHAFEPFFTTKAARGGTGLGLATVYGMVTQSGGRIELESEVGAGTSFTILLPSSAPERAEKAPHLTPRQREVLALLAQGLSTKAIAARLVCAETTARNHVNAILTSLGSHSRLEAVVKAQSLGLV